MLHKDTISDESIMSYSNVDVYLTSPQSNLNVMPLQKSMNQMANIPQPNCNMYMGNKQVDNMRAKQCSMRQIIPNQAYINNGVPCNRQILNSNAAVDNTNDRMRFNHLYQIAECYNPIEKLTLPVDNGDICCPLVLSNNQMITEYNFNLTEESLNEIIQREDLDIVLYSRLAQKDNSINLLRWPNVLISINDNQLTLEMKHFTKISIHLPQYIKNHCVIGRNVLKFEILDSTKFNMAAFHFFIYMVHRPTIANAKQLAINNAFISDELTFKLLRENCLGLHREFVHISTLCPITKKRIEIPARLKCCTHLQPFDLVGFLKMQARWMLTTCPLCYNSMTINFNGRNRNIVIDKILNSIFEKVPIGYDMVRVNVNASFNTIPNSIYPGIEYNQGMHHGNNVMVSGHGMQHVSEMNGNMIMHQSQPLPPNYRPSDQSMNFQIINGNPYRMIHNPINPMSIDSRSMLDLNPTDEQTMQSCMKYPHQTHVYPNDKPLVKKPVKRKLSRKSTPKSKIDANPNIVNNTNQISNGAITPPSTRTSSVASTSSPDSLNVPHMNLKRPPSIDLLSSTVLSDCHLSTGDEMALFSATSVSQMNNMSFNNQTQIHQPQQQHYQHLYQLPPESKPISNWSTPEQLIMQQQLQQQHFQQQQHHNKPLSQHQQHMQQHQIHQIQQQQIQQQQIQQQQIQHQQIQHQQIQQQQIQLQQPPQHIQSQQDQQDQQQFLMGLPSSTPSFYPNQNSINTSYTPGSVKPDSMHYPPGSVKQEPPHYPPSVKQEPLNYPPSVKLEPDHPHQTGVLDNSSNSFTHQQLSNSSCSSSINSFADHILSTFNPVSEADELPWLEGFNFSDLQESVNLSDMEDF